MSLFVRVLVLPLVVSASIVVLAACFISDFFPLKSDLDFGQQDECYPVWPDID